VPHHVRHTLLRNPEQLCFDILRQPSLELRRIGNANVSLHLEPSRHSIQRFVQSEVIENDGTQQLGKLTHVANRLI
jgi:hypothetical protein